MIEFNNQQDQNLWSCLEDFDLEKSRDVQGLRVELYLSLMKTLGTCSRCINYNKIDSFCNILKTQTGCDERCSSFEAPEDEPESAFDVMTEDFRREQENLSVFSRIRKYSRRPNIIRKDDKNGRNPLKESK